MQKKSDRREVVGIFLLGMILLLGFILAGAPTWVGSDVNYTTSEDQFYYHNLSNNITGFNGDVTFAINTLQTNITWTNGTGSYNVSSSDVSFWIKIYNSATGNLTINASYDNQTGFFQIPIEAKNTTDDEATTTIFEFVINATNDYPNFTNIESIYNLTQNQNFFEYLNASDEEGHYPLIFNISFFNNCTHASWSGRAVGENCSILNLSAVNNISTYMNLTPVRNDAGAYWANITIMDAGANYDCPHTYCDDATYEVNKTTLYSGAILFNVLSTLEINITNCTDKVFQEDQFDWCLINITTIGETDSLNVSSYANLRNYASGQSSVVNTSWFYANSSLNAAGYVKTINISLTPDKTEIGNWTISFSVYDVNHNQTVTENIPIYVNRTSNDVPDLMPIANETTSIDLETVISLTVYDDDLLIPDKNTVYGGYNETIDFDITILNLTTLAGASINGFDVDILYMPVAGTNRTTAEIRFTPNSTTPGEYIINISVSDDDLTSSFETFNLTILDNSAPQWVYPLTTTFVIYENNNTYLNFTMNVSDPDLDTLTFSYVNNTPFPSFNLTTAGILNFTAVDSDVGGHLVNITVSDGYLINTTTFNFTVLNINDDPVVRYMDATNATPTSNIVNGSSVNVTEDNRTVLSIWIEDDDLKIPISQKSFYNESFTFNLTISGTNTSLFNFSIDSSWWPQPSSNSNFPNRTKFDATFTSHKDDLGDYNVTINFTDLSGSSTVFVFNMTILEIQHAPEMSSLSNFSSGVNRTFYYDINVTDSEDGNDTSYELNTNFTFSYTNLSGNDIFSGFFNSTTGIFNITFSDSNSGKYHLNISVNDSGGLIDYSDFWIYVYGPPNIVAPAAETIFTLQESNTTELNFTVNHSIEDDLFYEFYVDGLNYNSGNFSYTGLILRYNTSSYGDGTNVSFSFTPNLTDETYGLLKNLTLIVYPATDYLENASLLNSSANFKLNITHTNSPVNLSDNIDDKGPTTYGTSITVNLSQHFSDDDTNDPYYSQAISYTFYSNTSDITSSISANGILTISSTIAVVGQAYVVASDSFSNATSNNFIITFVEPEGTSTTFSSSGGSSVVKIPVSLKILMPDPISVYAQDHIELPITIYNDGEPYLYDINISGLVAFDGILADDVKISFSNDYFKSLSPGEKQNITMYLDINTEKKGTFEITVNASVRNPKYKDWGKLYLTIKEGEDIMEKILFTEEFIVENPECLELREIINEAKKLAEEGKNDLALKKSQEAIDACRELIAQASQAKKNPIIEDKLYRYLIVSTLIVFFVGISFYSYKRMMLRRKRGSFLQESIKNKQYFK